MRKVMHNAEVHDCYFFPPINLSGSASSSFIPLITLGNQTTGPA